MKKSGFTLIELLVVIAIIAILAAILFPVFAKAREKGRQAACTSNMKQIGISFAMYAQDYDDYLPLFWDGDSSVSAPHLWMGLLAPYITKAGEAWLTYDTALRCPNVKLRTGWSYAVGSPTEIGGNAAVCGYFDATHNMPSKKIADLKQEQALFLEGKNFMWYTYDLSSTMTDPTSGYSLPMRHNDGILICYPDGHVKWMSKGDVWNPTNWDKLRGNID